MRIGVLLLVFLSVAFIGWGQTENIVSVSYETYTRGYRQNITIRPDSTLIKNIYQPEKNSRRKTSPADWKNITSALAGLPLPELINLPVPTNNRARDAARFSTISIQTSRQTYKTKEFDGYQAPAKLAKLMAVIKQLETRLVPK